MPTKVWICNCHRKQFDTYQDCVKHETIELLAGHLTTRDWTEGDYESILEMLDSKKETILHYYQTVKRTGTNRLFELNNNLVPMELLHDLVSVLNEALKNKAQHYTVKYGGAGFMSVNHPENMSKDQKAILKLLSEAGYKCRVNINSNYSHGYLEIKWSNTDD